MSDEKQKPEFGREIRIMKRHQKADWASELAPARCSASGYRLEHTVGKGNGRFVMSLDKQVILDTGSSVLVLKMLRRLHLNVPEIMGGPNGFESDWVAKWVKTPNGAGERRQE